MSVSFKHPDYKLSQGKWKLVNDVCDADNLQDYLIKRNPLDATAKNAARNDQIFKRAVFSAIAGYTSRGFVGQIFAKQPKITLPSQLEYLLTDCDGTGNSIYQQSQDTTKDVTRIGRSGLFVDFPSDLPDDEVSKASLESGEVFATLIKYNASQIINWKESRIGSKNKLSLVVLELTEDLAGEDGFMFESVPLIIELRLLNNENQTVFVVQEWRKSIENSDEWIPGGYSSPLSDGSGNLWTEIPFTFVGSESNTTRVDQPPMHDISKINVGHYNNSAIYEDSVFIVGQAQPWASGITSEMIKTAETDGMYFGSGQLIGVPSGERLGIAQVSSNSMAKEAMDDKVQSMIGLGAMFLQPGSAVKTATQSAGEQRVQHSVLSLIAFNVSEAYTQAIEWAGMYMQVDTNEAIFTLNGDFIDPDADAQTITAMTAKFLQGAIPISDYLKWEQKHGLVDPEKTLVDYQEELRPTPMPDLDE